MICKSYGITCYNHPLNGGFNTPPGMCIYNAKDLFKGLSLGLFHRPPAQPLRYRIHADYLPPAVRSYNCISYRVKCSMKVLFTHFYLLLCLLAFGDVLMGSDKAMGYTPFINII